MCTRFFIDKAEDEIAHMIGLAEGTPLMKRFIEAGDPLTAGGEVRPTDVVPVIAPDRKGKAAVYPMKWGFTVREHSLLFNARSESAASKPTFRELWNSHRCVIPASYYFEWKHYKDQGGKDRVGKKYTIQPVDSDITWLCGLYRIENDLPVFVVLTRDAVGELAEIHDRMPVIVPKKMVGDWVRPENDPSAMMRNTITDGLIMI
ncbi:MAG: SOS response-associated peptidase [Oscillospiraceae bacterium]|nr:SOS response-associated peptidase [Oscillospiraceae bacterium]